MEIDKANALANPVLLDLPAFLKVTPERKARALVDYEDKVEWVMPTRSPTQGDYMKALDPKFEEIVIALGYNPQTRAGRDKVLGLADDPVKSREFLAKFHGVDAVEGTDQEAQSQAEVILRQQLDLPEVKGDADMAKAKKAAAKADKKAKKTPVARGAVVKPAKKEPGEKKPSKLGGVSVTQDMKIKVLAKENPKREGTKAHKLFEKYKNGMTVAECVKAGMPILYVRYDVAKGFISAS